MVIVFSSDFGNASGPEKDRSKLGDAIGEIPGDAVCGVDDDDDTAYKVTHTATLS